MIFFFKIKSRFFRGTSYFCDGPSGRPRSPRTTRRSGRAAAARTTRPAETETDKSPSLSGRRGPAAGSGRGRSLVAPVGRRAAATTTPSRNRFRIAANSAERTRSRECRRRYIFCKNNHNYRCSTGPFCDDEFACFRRSRTRFFLFFFFIRSLLNAQDTDGRGNYKGGRYYNN